MHSAAVGFGLGFLVALQLGPMSLFLVRSTLRAGLPTGLAVGAGIAVVDALYASAGAAGAAPLLLVDPVRLVLGVAGAAVLVRLGARTLVAAWQVRLGLEDGSPYPAFRTSLAATASNPLTVVSWAAVFSAASSSTAAVPLVAGVGVGSLTWVSLLALGTAVVRRSVGARATRIADGVAGAGLVGFGGLLGWRTLHDA